MTELGGASNRRLLRLRSGQVPPLRHSKATVAKIKSGGQEYPPHTSISKPGRGCPALHYLSLFWIFCGQGALAFGEQGPGFLVGFVPVAVFFQWDHGEKHDDGFARAAEDDDGGDDVPDILGDHIRGEEVDLFDGVVLLLEERSLDFARDFGTRLRRRVNAST